MPKGYSVYTKVTDLCNRFQIACALSWSISRLCAINAKTCHINLRGAHHLSLPTLCVGLHPMAQENYHRAQLTGFDAIPDEEFTSLNQSYSLLIAVFTWAKVLNMCGLRWSADFMICISSLPKPINLQQLSRDLMQVWIVILHDFHASAIGSLRCIWPAVINAQRGHICYCLCDFTTDKCVFHNLLEHKDCSL